jgi:hypothetical protein
MRLSTESFVEHQTAGQQEIGTQAYGTAQFVVGGASTCCEGCSSTSCCCAATNQDLKSQRKS